MKDKPTQQHRQEGRNILVFGATGSTGRQVVNRALELGYAVTAFVRDPMKAESEHPALTYVQGDVLDPEAVEKAMPGHVAVVSSLGAGRNGTVRSQGTQNIIRAMERKKIRRLICQSSLGVGDSHGNLNFFWKNIMFGLLLRKAFADHVRQEAVVRESRLDWTIVRPGALTDGGRTGSYRHGFSGTAKKLKLKISTGDVADFMLNQLDDDTYLHAAPGLSY